MAPIFKYLFKDNFRYIILHRHPIFYAASRSVMGNYYLNSFYKNKAHELSPFDTYTLFPEYKEIWPTMNPFEKNLFWWLEATSEMLEFNKLYPEVPHMVVKSDEMFSSKDTLSKMIKFMGLNTEIDLNVSVEKNELNAFALESFPLKNQWLKFYCHKKIIDLGEKLGYNFDEQFLEKKLLKYQVPQKLLPQLRHLSKYWFRSDLKF